MWQDSTCAHLLPTHQRAADYVHRIIAFCNLKKCFVCIMYGLVTIHIQRWTFLLCAWENEQAKHIHWSFKKNHIYEENKNWKLGISPLDITASLT